MINISSPTVVSDENRTDNDIFYVSNKTSVWMSIDEFFDTFF